MGLLSEQFPELATLSLTRLRELLEYKLETIESETVRAKIASEQRQAAVAMVNAQVRVDEARLRAESTDVVGRILEEVKAEAARLVNAAPPPKATSYLDLV